MSIATHYYSSISNASLSGKVYYINTLLTDDAETFDCSIKIEVSTWDSSSMYDLSMTEAGMSICSEITDAASSDRPWQCFNIRFWKNSGETVGQFDIDSYDLAARPDHPDGIEPVGDWDNTYQ